MQNNAEENMPVIGSYEAATSTLFASVGKDKVEGFMTKMQDVNPNVILDHVKQLIDMQEFEMATLGLLYLTWRSDKNAVHRPEAKVSNWKPPVAHTQGELF